MIASRKKATPNPAVILVRSASNPLFLPKKREDPPPNAPRPSSLLGRIVTSTIKAKETINKRTEKKFTSSPPTGLLIVLLYQSCPPLTRPVQRFFVRMFPAVRKVGLFQPSVPFPFTFFIRLFLQVVESCQSAVDRPVTQHIFDPQ